MSCRYSDYEGKCQLWEDEGDNNIDGYGFDYSNGYCTCEDDDDPSITCESYDEG